MEPITFMTVLSGFLGGTVSAGVFKGPIQTLEDIWYIKVGHSFGKSADKLRAKHAADLELYKKDIIKQLSEIPTEKVQEPKLNIIGPALEASMYYIEEPELRKMFARVIAASMDKSKNDIIHNSYVEIIKQLTPLDAKDLTAVFHGADNMIAGFKMVLSNNVYQDIFTNLYLGNPEEKDQGMIGASLDNLQRLGLVNLDYSSFVTPLERYDIFKKLEEYQTSKSVIKGWNHSNPTINPEPEPEITPGIIKLTNFGKNFCTTCLD